MAIERLERDNAGKDMSFETGGGAAVSHSHSPHSGESSSSSARGAARDDRSGLASPFGTLSLASAPRPLHSPLGAGAGKEAAAREEARQEEEGARARPPSSSSASSSSRAAAHPAARASGAAALPAAPREVTPTQTPTSCGSLHLSSGVGCRALTRGEWCRPRGTPPRRAVVLKPLPSEEGTT